MWQHSLALIEGYGILLLKALPHIASTSLFSILLKNKKCYINQSCSSSISSSISSSSENMRIDIHRWPATCVPDDSVVLVGVIGCESETSSNSPSRSYTTLPLNMVASTFVLSAISLKGMSKIFQSNKTISAYIPAFKIPVLVCNSLATFLVSIGITFSTFGKFRPSGRVSTD